eukprot:scaffold8593_cov248-Pinguiococcus_pyrenoidosus.AAC.1
MGVSDGRCLDPNDPERGNQSVVGSNPAPIPTSGRPAPGPRSSRQRRSPRAACPCPLPPTPAAEPAPRGRSRPPPWRTGRERGSSPPHRLSGAPPHQS